MKIRLFSPYNHFPEHVPKEGEKYIDCYNDGFIKRMFPVAPEKSIALLIEPRPLQPKIYEYVENNYDDYKYIFTHDSILLNKLPNAKLIIWGGIWGWGNEEKDFSHPISMVASWKEQAPVRIERKHLAMEMKDKIDCYGTFDGGEYASTHDIYAKYPYSVVIENHIDDWWITEKICNCFANNTVPIYFGANNIGKLFNINGIIQCHSIDEIRTKVDFLLEHGVEDYNQRLDAIADNRERVKQYENFERWFYNEYGGLLDEMDYSDTLL